MYEVCYPAVLSRHLTCHVVFKSLMENVSKDFLKKLVYEDKSH